MLAFCASLCAVGAVGLSTAYADGTAGETTTIANDDGFYMTKGAQVRIPTSTKEGYDGTGIRFAVNLQEAYIQQLESTYETVTFYSVIAVDGAAAVAPNGITLEEKTTVIDKVAYLEWSANDYGTLKDGLYTYYITPTNMQKGYDIELTVGAIAKVTDENGQVSYLQAKANDNTRTMESVAFAAYLDNKTDSNYAYLNKYYGTATNYQSGHAQEYGESTVSFAKDITVSELSDGAYACVGATKVALTDGTVNLDTAEQYLTAGETYPVSIFDGDKVYVKDVLYVTRELNQASDLSIFNLTTQNVTGYYLVTEDIDATAESANTHTDLTNNKDSAAGGIDWDFDYAFMGTFDGNGHTVTVNTDKGGLFGNLKNATIVDTNFVLNVTGTRKTNTDKWPTGLAYSAENATISNVYAELNPATGLDSASGRTWALTLIVNAPKTLKFENVVVVNNDNFANLQASDSGWVSGAFIYVDAAREDGGVRDTYRKNVFVIAPEQLGNGYYVPMSGGTVKQVFANNDSKGKADGATKTGATQFTYANVTRYDNVASFVQSFVWENKISDFIMENLLANATTVSVGETDLQNNGEIAVSLNTEQTVTLKVGERTLTDVVLSCVDGAENVEINGNTFTLTEIGNATLMATGKLGEMETVATFTVSFKSTTHEGVVLFSGADGDVDVKTIFGEGATLISAYGEDGTPYSVADNKIAGLTNATNAPVEKTLLLQSGDNEWTYVTFKVYTQLLDEAKDLSIFSLTDKDIAGCYLVTTNLDASEEVANPHKDLTDNKDSAAGGIDWDFDYAFTGVFDGAGHTVTVNTNKGGLFGHLKNATITNTNFILNVTGTRKSNTDKWPTGLAYTLSGSQATTTISNVYAKLNPAAGLDAASGRTWAISLIVNATKALNLNNVVVVNNDDFSNMQASGDGWVAGALFYSDTGRADGGFCDTYRKNVYVIAAEKLSNGYYIPMAGGTHMQSFASNAPETALTEAHDRALAKTQAESKSTQYKYTNVIRYSTINDFVDGNAWNGVLADFIMSAVRVDYITAPQS